MHRNHLSLALIPAIAIVAPSAWAIDYLSVEQAQAALFPEADTFTSHPISLTPDQRKQMNKLSVVRKREDKQQVWKVLKGDTYAGWFIVDEVIGKHDYITYAAALAPDGKVIGVEIMTYRETYGGQVRDEAWRKHFVGKTLKDPFKLDQDIPNISGATLSSRNVMNGVKRLLALQQVALPHA